MELERRKTGGKSMLVGNELLIKGIKKNLTIKQGIKAPRKFEERTTREIPKVYHWNLKTIPQFLPAIKIFWDETETVACPVKIIPLGLIRNDDD